jgi:putative ABC transport system permease protein
MPVPPRWRKVARDLLAHKLRTALVVLSIAVGIFAILVVMGGRGILLQAFDTNFAKSDPANATLVTSGFDQMLVNRVGRAADVSGAEGRRVVSLRYQAGDLTKVVDPPLQVTEAQRQVSITLTAAQDWATSKIDRVFPEGTLAWPPGRDEVVLEVSDTQISPLAVGDLITVRTTTGDKKLLRVVGFAHDINAFPALFVGQISGYVSLGTMADLGVPSGMNELLITLDAPNLTRASASVIVSHIRDDVMAPTGVVTYNTQVPVPGSQRLGDIFKAVSILLLALGAMALALSGFLVVNTVSALLTQQVRQVGIMKAIGGRAVQIGTLFLALVAIYGLLAVLVGLPTGAYMASWFAKFAGGLLDFGPAATFPPAYTVALAVAVGFLVPLLAALLPIRSGTRVSVVTALTATGMTGADFGHGTIDRLLGRLRGLPRPVALSLRNTFLRKGRLAMTLTTLILASAVVMSVGTVRASILTTVSDVSKWWNYDVEVNFSAPVSERVADREAAKVQGVTSTEGWLVAGATMKRSDGSENTQLSLIGLPPKTTFVTPFLTAGRWLTDADGDAVVVNTDVVTNENLAVGDSVKLTVRGLDHVFKIVGVVRGQLMGPVFFANRSYVAGLYGLQGSISRLLVRTADHSEGAQDAAADRLDRQLSDAGLPVASAEGQARMSDSFASQLGILVTFLIIMAVILAAVGVIGLSGTMIINVLESTREIGVMRAIGASHASIYQVFVTEGVVIGVLSWAGGLVLSWPMSYALVHLLEGAIGVPLTYSFSWAAVGGWLVLVAAISAVASLVPAFRASQVSVRDAISYE